MAQRVTRSGGRRRWPWVLTLALLVVPTAELAGLTPTALYELGLVLLVAITYVPETARHFQRIREAQAIRGHRLRGLRDWRPIVIPLLVGGTGLYFRALGRGLSDLPQAAPAVRAQIDRLQAAGMGFYCTTEPDFMRIVLHAVFVVHDE